jgi:hypothetical protein
MTHPRTLLAPLLVVLLAVTLAACSDDESKSGSDSGAGAKTTQSAPDEVDDPATTTEDSDSAHALRIEPGSGITGIAVGDTREQVVAALGEPAKTTDVKNEFSGGTNERLEFDGPRIAVLVQAVGGKSEVLQVEVSDPTLATEDGDISIGASQDELLEAFPAARCDTGIGTTHICRLGTERAGEVVTDFFVEDEQVVRIVVGRILD